MNPMFSLNWRDIVKGLVVAVLSPVVLALYNLVAMPNFTFNMISFEKLAIVGLAAGLGYLVKNVFTDSSGRFLGLV